MKHLNWLLRGLKVTERRDYMSNQGVCHLKAYQQLVPGMIKSSQIVMLLQSEIPGAVTAVLQDHILGLNVHHGAIKTNATFVKK